MAESMKLTGKDIEERLWDNNSDVGIFIDCDNKAITVSELKQQILENQEIVERLKSRVEELNKYLSDLQEAIDFGKEGKSEGRLQISELAGMLEKEELRKLKEFLGEN